MPEIVVVTGAAGFVGSHCVKLLLERGHTVRGTVRDATNEKKTGFLKALPYASERLTLHSADLGTAGVFDEVLVGATACLHTAAMVQLSNDREGTDAFIRITVDGSKNLVASCAAAAKAGGTFKRFVHCSSTAAVQDNARPRGHVYSEEDWNESMTLERDPYSYSKVACEKMVRDEVAALEGDAKFSLAHVNPGAIYGPVLAAHHCSSSPQIMRDMLNGSMPMYPDFTWESIDVRDVAKAHVLLMEQPHVQGRFVCVNGLVGFGRISAAGKEAYPLHSFPKYRCPNFLLYITSLCDARLRRPFLRDNLSIQRPFTNAKIKHALNFEFTDMDKTLLDTFESMFEVGAVERKI